MFKMYKLEYMKLQQIQHYCLDLKKGLAKREEEN